MTPVLSAIGQTAGSGSASIQEREGGSVMVALAVLAAIGTLMAGTIVLAIVLMSVAIHREEKHLSLTSEAPDELTQAVRWVTGARARLIQL